MAGALAVLLLATTASASGSSTPWYQRDACRTAHATLMAAELEPARAAITELERSADVELQVCGAWLNVVFGDVEYILQGKKAALSERRMRRLQNLFKIAVRHGRQRAHMLDLAIEARMRRVRLLVAQGQNTAAIKEARKVEKMLDSRRKHPVNPSRLYARGLSDLAIGQAPWALRVLVQMAGLDGDVKRGRKHLETLASGESVYRADALVALFHFARKKDDPSAEEVERYGSQLAKSFGQNPQYLFDHAHERYKVGRCADALTILEPARARLSENRSLWSPRARKKVYWLVGRCALDTGNRSLAKVSFELASQQNHGGYVKELERLGADLKG